MQWAHRSFLKLPLKQWGPFWGAITTKWSWRWCFYLILPAGAVVILLVAVFLNLDKANERPRGPFREMIAQLDIIGNFLLVPAVACLLISLQWGCSKYPWSSIAVVIRLIASVVFFSLFLLTEIWRDNLAMLPLKIFKERTVFSAALFGFCSASALSTLDIYLCFTQLIRQ